MTALTLDLFSQPPPAATDPPYTLKTSTTGPTHRRTDPATDTRNASHRAVKREGVAEKQKAVLAVLESRGALSNRAVAAVLGWPVNTVTPRMFELRQMGRAVMAGRIWDCATERTVTAWRAVGGGGEG